jgi:hypothetical protein
LTHIVIAVLAWVLFGYYWSLVAQRRVTPNTIRGVQTLLVLVLLIWGVTTLWIQHNRRRFAGRPDRRKHRRATGPLPDEDHIGQTIVVAEPAQLPAAAYVEVEVDPETRLKTFRICDPPADEVTGA